MKAAVLDRQAGVDTHPLRIRDVAPPALSAGEILLQVEACGCCRTDLHVIEGDLKPRKLPVIPGHQVVGRVVRAGPDVAGFERGHRAGIAWLRHVDGVCRFCRTGRENLCPHSEYTGYSADGGFAEFAAVPAAFAYHLPEALPATEMTPLLCAGIIGYRALKRSAVKPGQKLGIFGFGSSAHVTIQVALHWGCQVFVVSRGESHRSLAREMGATWVGDSIDELPSKLDAAILFAPAGDLVPGVLRALDRGGTAALAGIHVSDLPPLSYEADLFYERSLTSVTANTRENGRELLALAEEIPIRSRVETFSLEDVNVALQRLKADEVNGSAVVVMG